MTAAGASAASPARAKATKRRATRTTAGVLTPVILRDYRSRWDGVVTKVLVGDGCGPMERGVGPGEIAVFEPTGSEFSIDEVHHLRGGDKIKTVKALEYRRVRTRLVGT